MGSRTREAWSVDSVDSRSACEVGVSPHSPVPLAILSLAPNFPFKDSAIIRLSTRKYRLFFYPYRDEAGMMIPSLFYFLDVPDMVSNCAKLKKYILTSCFSMEKYCTLSVFSGDVLFCLCFCFFFPNWISAMEQNFKVVTRYCRNLIKNIVSIAERWTV